MRSVAIIMVLLICVSGIPAPVSADTGESKTYSAHSDVVYDASTREVSVTTEITISSTSNTEKTNWETNWFIPSTAKVELVSAENGSVHFTKDYGRINIQRDSGKPTASETFTIKYTYFKEEGKSYLGDFHWSYFSFSGPEPKWSSDSVEFTVKKGSLDSVMDAQPEWKNNSTIVVNSTGFTAVISSQSMGEPTVETEDYVVYGDTNLSKSEIESAYQTAKTVTGMEPDSKIPVVFVNPETEIDGVGVYADGVVYVPQGAVSNEYTTLAHEFQHAYDERLIGYMIGIPRWFTEGTAQLTASRAEYAVNEEPDSFQNIDKVRSVESRDDLLLFTDFGANQSFAYDYSELIVKSFVQSEGLDVYQSAYKSLSENELTGFPVINNSDISSVGFPFKPDCTGVNTSECVQSTMDFVPAQNANISGSAPEYQNTTPAEQSPTTTSTTPTPSNEDSEEMPLMFYTQISLPVVALLIVVFLRLL